MQNRQNIIFIILIFLGIIQMNDLKATENKPDSLQIATFAGGCFWCMQPPFSKLDGIIATKVGYTGGRIEEPTYIDVSSGKTGHAEAIQITYDSTKVSYQKLLETFWHNIDPTTENRQFADQGTQYRTAIFYHNEHQKKLAEESKQKLEASGKFDKPIVTQILPASEFYKAEEYHQDYYLKNPTHYKNYKIGSGRAGYIKEKWGKE